MHDPVFHPQHIHTPARIAPSLLRLSVAQRLGIAAAFAVVLWLSVTWALGGFSS